MSKSLLQTKEWAALREGFGWQTHNVEDIFVLEKKLPLGKSFLYAPEVTFNNIKSHPELSSEGSLGLSKMSHSRQILRDAQNDNLQNFIENTKEIAQKSNSVFLRLEILDQNDTKIIEKLKENGLIKAFEEIQPEFRQIIPIHGSIDEILAGMKQKGRYNIKIAQKNNIQVKTSDNILEFYQMFLETARRDGFSIRPKDYFENMLEILGGQGYAELLVANYENKPVAAEIISYYNGVASYLYGASSNEYRNLMAPYLLHFEAIKRAKEKGCKIYDLLAVAPIGEADSSQTTDDSSPKSVDRSPSTVGHKYSGISRFKKQFGGETICLVGSYDLVFQPFWYKIFKIAEKMRRH